MVAVSTIILGLAQLATLATASPLLHQKRAPGYCESGGISRLADFLIADAPTATSFCSEFLAIPTITVPATQTIETYTTLTQTIDKFETRTETIATNTLRFTVTTTVATVPTVVATSSITRTDTLTSTVTPARVTTTTTVWYTRRPAKRDGIEKRALPTPTYLLGFSGPAISSACRCLDIPTPSVTATQTVYDPKTVETSVTKTVTNAVFATLTISTTTTISVTSYVPVTTTLTFSTNTLTTVTGTTPTSTVTISSAYRPQCTALLSRPKLYTAIQPKRSYSYPFATTLIPGGGNDEDTFSKCCELCYSSPNCAQFYTYNSGSQGYRCQIISSYTQVNSGITAQCPLGRLTNEGVSGPAAWTPSNQARGIGPCYGYDVPI
ncbi:hypothetical protein TWF281_001365 [Arthrobotrys megalospora]